MSNAIIDLTTIGALKTELSANGVTPIGDSDLALLLTAVSQQIQTYLQRNLISQSYTETRNGNGRTAMTFRNYPITAVASVQIDTTMLSPRTTPTGSGYVFANDTIMVPGYVFRKGVQNCVITYTAGLTTIPPDIVRAVTLAITAAQQLFSTGAPLGADSIQAGDTNIHFARSAAQFMTPDVTAILNPYRRMTPVALY